MGMSVNGVLSIAQVMTKKSWWSRGLYTVYRYTLQGTVRPYPTFAHGKSSTQKVPWEKGICDRSLEGII